jgi:hypothetical protein
VTAVAKRRARVEAEFASRMTEIPNEGSAEAIEVANT